MEQQMTSEKQMTVHWHISVECLYGDVAIAFPHSFLLRFFVFKLIQP